MAILTGTMISNPQRPATDFGFGPCFGGNHIPQTASIFSEFLNLDCSVIQKERQWHGEHVSLRVL